MHEKEERERDLGSRALGESKGGTTDKRRARYWVDMSEQGGANRQLLTPRNPILV